MSNKHKNRKGGGGQKNSLEQLNQGQIYPAIRIYSEAEKKQIAQEKEKKATIDDLVKRILDKSKKIPKSTKKIFMSCDSAKNLIRALKKILLPDHIPIEYKDTKDKLGNLANLKSFNIFVGIGSILDKQHQVILFNVKTLDFYLKEGDDDMAYTYNFTNLSIYKKDQPTCETLE